MTDQFFYDSVDLLRSLVASPRVSRSEHAAADLVESFIRSRSEEFGVSVSRIGCNVLAVPADALSNDPAELRPVILLNSHIDTVPPSPSWSRDPHDPFIDPVDSRLYGIGSNDAGASLVSLAAAFIYFLHHPSPSFRFIFLASCEEEVSGDGGISMVIPQLVGKIDAAIVGEPTGMRPAIAEKGLMVLDGVIKGRAGHAARDEGDNAIYRAMAVIDILRRFSFPSVSPLLGPVKVTVTQINAGTKHNVIPDRCDIVVDVRTTDLLDNLATLQILSQAVEGMCVLTPRSLRLNSSSIPVTHPIVRRLIMLGLEPFGSPTLSDQALMPWPSLKVGPGDSARSHSADEYILLDEIRQAIEIYIKILQ